MSSKETILQSIRQFKKEAIVPLPEHGGLNIMEFDDLVAQFDTALQSVGGKAVVLEEGAHLDEAIRSVAPDAKTIVCNVKTCGLSDNDGSSFTAPHALAKVDLAIVKGEFAVAENGAVWVKNPDNRHRALYFVAEHIIIVVEKNALVPTMHEAYEKINFDTPGFGVFVSGPSKTADIEQSLVIGAHGPKSGYVFFV
jgi:L-lactate dehydrogenase complex protein LldG